MKESRVIQRLKKVIYTKAFRVIFVVTFIISMIVFPIYAYSIFYPYFGYLLLILIAAYIVLGKHLDDLSIVFRRRYWWLELVLVTLSSAFFSYRNYALNKIRDLVFSATLCLISVGCLIYYSTLRKRSYFVTNR